MLTRLSFTIKMYVRFSLYKGRIKLVAFEIYIPELSILSMISRNFLCNCDLLPVFLCEHFTWKSLQTNLFVYFNLFTHLSRSLYSKRVSSLESHRIPGSAQNLRRDTPEWFFGSFQCIERIHHAVLAAVKPSAFIFYSSLPSLVIFPPFFFLHSKYPYAGLATLYWKKISANRRYSLLFLEKVWNLHYEFFHTTLASIKRGAVMCTFSWCGEYPPIPLGDYRKGMEEEKYAMKGT